MYSISYVAARSIPLLIFAAGLLPVGCKGTSDPDDEFTAERRVMTASGRPEVEAGAPAEWFDEQLRIIEREIAAGELEAALYRAFAVREKNPTLIHRTRLDQLIRRANSAVLGLETVDAKFTVDSNPIEFGERIQVRVRMKNLGRRAIRIPKEVEGTSGSVFEIVLVRREWDTRSQVVTTTKRYRLPLSRDWEIPASGTAEQLLDLGMCGNDRGMNGFRVYHVRGKLRAARVEIGGLRRWDSVPVKGVFLRSFRPNWKHLADDPLKRVKQALEKQAPTHLLTATALLEGKDRQEAMDALVDELRGDRVIDWAIFGCLEYLARIGLGRDVNAWKAWWPRVREHYFDEEVGKRDSGPSFELDR